MSFAGLRPQWVDMGRRMVLFVEIMRITKQTPRYSDVIMNAKASQIAGVSIICLTICSGADLRKL